MDPWLMELKFVRRSVAKAKDRRKKKISLLMSEQYREPVLLFSCSLLVRGQRTALDPRLQRLVSR